MSRAGVGDLTGSQDLVSGVEDFLRRPLRDHVAFYPSLNVAPAVFGSGQSQRFAADERHRLGLNLPQVPGCVLRVAHRVLRSVTKKYVTKLVKGGLMRHWIDRADGDLSLPGIAHTVAVKVLERDFGDRKSAERL